MYPNSSSVPLGTKVVYYRFGAGALLAGAHGSAELVELLEPCHAVGMARLCSDGTHQFHRIADKSLEASGGHFVQVAQGMVYFDSKSTHVSETTRRVENLHSEIARELLLLDS